MKLIELAKSGDRDSIGRRGWPPDELNARDENGRTAVMHAAMRGDYRLIELLKSLGADISLKDDEELKAVDHAARHGHSTAIIYLIEGGCGG